MKQKHFLEACVGSVQSAIEAQKGGADRVELCANLFEGGTTPSAGTIYLTRKAIQIGIHVIIRPRGGDFLYSDLEFEEMKYDIEMAKKLGADGVVIGLLLPNGQVDVARTTELVKLASPMQVTFHRAFDMANNAQQALEDVIATGCSRILTSGCANKAIEGIHQIACLSDLAKGRITIMAGSGVSAENAELLIKEGKITNLHMSGRTAIPSLMQYRNPAISMGSVPQIPEYDIMETDTNKIREVKSILEQLEKQ